MRTANFLKATRQIADEALYRSTFGSGPGVLPTASFIVYFMRGGDDITGNGSDEFPFATPGKALAYAHSLGPTPANPALVLGGPGTFPAAIQMPPNVFLCALEPGFTLSIGPGAGTAVSLSPAWVGVSAIGAIEEVIIAGDAVIDFTGSPNSSFSYGNAVTIGGNTTITGDGATLSGFSVFEAVSVGTFTATALAFTSQGSVYASPVTFRSSATQQAFLDPSSTDAFEGGITLDATAGKNVTAVMVGSGVTGQLTLHDGGGGVTSYTSTADGIPPTVNLLGGAAPPVLSTSANALGYVAVGANWVAPPPTTVQQAIDRIAANVGNAHPIP